MATEGLQERSSNPYSLSNGNENHNFSLVMLDLELDEAERSTVIFGNETRHQACLMQDAPRDYTRGAEMLAD